MGAERGVDAGKSESWSFASSVPWRSSTTTAPPSTLPGGRARAPCSRCSSCTPTRPSASTNSPKRCGATSPPPSAANALQAHVSKLRRAIGDRVSFTGAGYRFDLDGAVVDARTFEALVADGRALGAADDPAARRTCSATRSHCWRGPAFADFADAEFARGRSACGSTRLRVGAIEDRIDYELELGQGADLVGELEALVVEHPLRERLRGQLMRALYRAGRQADALRAYPGRARHARRRTRHRPRPRAAATSRPRSSPRIASLTPRVPRRSRRTPTPVPNIHPPFTPLVGRTAELAAVRAELDGARLVTLVGPGGAGKTRLAVEAAPARLAEHDDGVWMVELAGVLDPDSHHDRHRGDAAHPRRAALRRGRGVSARSGRRVPRREGHAARARQLRARRDRRRAPRRAVARAGVPDSASSRPAARDSASPGERLWPVPPLPVDDAIELFSQRAAGLRRRRRHRRGTRHACATSASGSTGSRSRSSSRRRAHARSPVGEISQAARPAVPAPHRREPHRAPPPTDAARRRRLELRPAVRRRATRLRTALGVRGRVHARRRGSRVRRRRPARRRHRRPRRPASSTSRSCKPSDGRDGALHDVADARAVRPRAARGASRSRDGSLAPRRVLRRARRPRQRRVLRHTPACVARERRARPATTSAPRSIGRSSTTGPTWRCGSRAAWAGSGGCRAAPTRAIASSSARAAARATSTRSCGPEPSCGSPIWAAWDRVALDFERLVAEAIRHCRDAGDDRLLAFASFALAEILLTHGHTDTVLAALRRRSCHQRALADDPSYVANHTYIEARLAVLARRPNGRRAPLPARDRASRRKRQPLRMHDDAEPARRSHRSARRVRGRGRRAPARARVRGRHRDDGRRDESARPPRERHDAARRLRAGRRAPSTNRSAWARELAFMSAIAFASNGIAMRHRFEGDPAAADRAGHGSARDLHARRTCPRAWRSRTRSSGSPAADLVNRDDADRFHRDGLDQALVTGNPLILALALEGLAGVAVLDGDGERAARLLGKANALRSTTASEPGGSGPVRRRPHHRRRDRARRAPTPSRRRSPRAHDRVRRAR